MGFIFCCISAFEYNIGYNEVELYLVLPRNCPAIETKLFAVNIIVTDGHGQLYDTMPDGDDIMNIYKHCVEEE